ncbi:thioredoxin [Methanosarcina sp. MSH10X1]|uniref:thioredoxin family protein n=1 Tax=Methanosarcina sp. MSH10X1 TaxID=2507075 RepID=UPI000FFCB2C8|nr:thioredoxin family protein [Methanosarcina sp. MSH10X1]RXA17080.1 thioredoxin [Methanosarcina sp. MSH10X1]
MKKLVILLILLATVIFTAGCTEESQEDSANTQAIQERTEAVEATEPEQNTTSQEIQEEGNVVEVAGLEEINTTLQQGPVLMKIGSERCGPCKAMKPMLQELATEYEGRAKVVSIDIDRSPDLAVYFGIGYIPDSTVIIGITDGEYVYMKPDGSVTTDRFQARILGTTEKSTLEDVMNLALIQAEKDKS